MSANAHKLIIAILILLVASFSSAHAAPNSGASAIYLVAPPPPSQFVPGCAVHRRLPKKTPSHPPALYSRACTLYSVSASSHPESGEEPQHRCLASAWAPIGRAWTTGKQEGTQETGRFAVRRLRQVTS